MILCAGRIGCDVEESDEESDGKNDGNSSNESSILGMDEEVTIVTYQLNICLATVDTCRRYIVQVNWKCK